jgi:hypothetical protein
MRPYAALCDAMRCDAMRCDAMRCDAMRCDAMMLGAYRVPVAMMDKAFKNKKGVYDADGMVRHLTRTAACVASMHVART